MASQSNTATKQARYSLEAVPELQPLKEIIDQRPGLEITFHGSFVRRLVRARSRHRNRLCSLYDLVPFSSDIDIRHNGSKDDTFYIHDFVQKNIPFAECYRWEIRSDAESRTYDEAENNIIPACALKLPLNGEVPNNHEGVRDITKGRYTFKRNSKYKVSSLYQGGKDLEVFSVVLYFKAIAELPAQGMLNPQPGWSTCREIICDSIKDVEKIAMLLVKNDKLRKRFHYLLTSFSGTTPNYSVWLMSWMSGLGRFLRQVDERMRSITGDSNAFDMLGFRYDLPSIGIRTMMISSSLAKGAFRVPLLGHRWFNVPGMLKERLAEANLSELLHERQRVHVPAPRLADGIELALHSKPILMHIGKTTEAEEGAVDLKMAQEFIYLSVPLSLTNIKSWFFRSDRLALVPCITFRVGSVNYSMFLPLQNLVWLRWRGVPIISGRLLLLSVNFSSILETLPELLEHRNHEITDCYLQFFVLRPESRII